MIRVQSFDAIGTLRLIVVVRGQSSLPVVYSSFADLVQASASFIFTMLFHSYEIHVSDLPN